jgi:CheY-like chemotaxis protein
MNEPSPILLVDDDSTDAMLFKRAIEHLKIINPVIHMKTCREGLDYLRNPDDKKPWIVITDLNTPDMNGLELLKAVKADEALRHIIVIILSGSGDESDIAVSYELGAAGYMVKPSDHKKLVEIISTIHAYWTLSELPNESTASKPNCSSPLR